MNRTTLCSNAVSSCILAVIAQRCLVVDLARIVLFGGKCAGTFFNHIGQHFLSQSVSYIYKRSPQICGLSLA